MTSLQSISEPRQKNISSPNETIAHSIGGEGLFTKRKPGGLLAIHLPKKPPDANNKKRNKIIPVITRSSLVRGPSPALSAFSSFKLKRAESNFCSTIQKCSLEEIKEYEESPMEN